jgi:N-acetylglucosamine-6-phosphate deacetylase
VSQEQRLRCERLVTPNGVLERAVVTIRDSFITDVRASSDSTGSADISGSAGIPVGADLTVSGWTVPGFVDTHVHGGGSFDYATTDPEQVLAARAFHRRHGTTSSFASLVTAEPDVLVEQISTLVPLVQSDELAGIHLEGPFLSPAKAGAHDVSQLRLPEPELLDRLFDAGQGCIAMITLAPELPGALEAVRRIVDAGAVAAIGHTDGDEAVTRRALDAGAGVVTHLFNAMRPVHHRTPGPVPLLLSDDRATVELICDGFHLHRDVVTMAIAAAGPERVALVTDAMLAAGAPDGRYQLGSLPVTVVDGQARLLSADGRPGSIAGSTLTMAGAFAFVVAAGLSIPDAATMAAATPARRHQLAAVGAIQVGARADLCVVNDLGRLQRVMHRGRWLEND